MSDKPDPTLLAELTDSTTGRRSTRWCQATDPRDDSVDHLVSGVTDIDFPIHHDC